MNHLGGGTSRAEGGLRDRDVVCVGSADWESELWTNQQHLMSRLARDNRVLFVESLGLRRPKPAARDLRRMARRARRGVAPPRRVDGLRVLSPLVLPFHGSRLAREVNGRLLPALVRRAAHRLGMREPLLWSYVPQAEALLGALDPALVIYHCVDDLAAQKGVDAEAFRSAETRFAARADLVVASSPALVERMQGLSSNVVYAPNVADTSLFARALAQRAVDPGLAAVARPRLVFTGAVVATKLDVELLVDLARRRPDWSLALVGPVGAGDPSTDVSAFDRLANVHLLGHRRYEQLPAVLAGADAALIPYAVNALTSSVFPMKVYEYLAAGLPVVTTPLPALRGVEGIAVAADAEEMEHHVVEALAQDSPERRAERSRLAARHSWEVRLEQLDEAIAAL